MRFEEYVSYIFISLEARVRFYIVYEEMGIGVVYEMLNCAEIGSQGIWLVYIVMI